MTEAELDRYRKDAARAAKQLGYSNEVIVRIKNAQSESEICRIMITARNELSDE